MVAVNAVAKVKDDLYLKIITVKLKEELGYHNNNYYYLIHASHPIACLYIVQ